MVASFILFLIYITAIFFLPNGGYLLYFLAVNLIFAATLSFKYVTTFVKIWQKTLGIVPFILFTMVFNWWLDSWMSAAWIGLKLLIVCNATMIYSSTTTVNSVALLVSKLCAPLKYFGIQPAEVRILVSISLMMIPLLRKDLQEMREACRAKGIRWNFSAAKITLQKLGWTLIRQVRQLEEALLAKGSSI